MTATTEGVRRYTTPGLDISIHPINISAQKHISLGYVVIFI
jgi:hypothetical protein